MKKEVLRLQMLSGIITESEYKEKTSKLTEGFGTNTLNENKQKTTISKKELAKIISEEIVRFKKKSLLENRLREIDEELKNLNQLSESFKMNENSQELNSQELEEDIFDYEPAEGDENYDEWEKGEKNMSDGLLRGNYDLYEQGFQKKAEVLKAVGYSEDDVDRWKESKADSFDNY